MSKDLTFKLVLDGDSKGLVIAATQSKESMEKLLEAIRSESEKLRNESEKTSKEVGKIVPDELAPKAEKAQQELKDTSDQVKQLATESTKTATEVSDLADDLEKTANTADKTDRAIDELGNETEQAATQVDKLDQELGQTNQELHKTDATSSKTEASISNLKKAVGVLAAGLAALGVGMSAKEFINLSDATQQMNSRLRNATEGVEDYNQVQSRMLDLANATFRPLEEAQEVYLATAGTMKSLGYSTDEILTLTESLSLSFTHNATRTDQAQAAQDALAKSMAKGSVDADAWLSIITGADNIVGDLARSTGRTEAEIRQLGASGKISLNELVQAIILSKDRNLELANAMENSTADASQVLKNKIRDLVGQLNEQYNISSRLAEVIQSLGGDMDWIAVLFDDAMSAVEALSSEFENIDPSVFSSLKEAISAAYEAVKQIATGAYELGKIIFDVLNESFTNALSIFSAFSGEVSEAGERVGFLTRVGQGLSIALGAVSDGVYTIRIALNLWAAAFYQVAEAANRVMAAVTWGDVSKQFSANADKMKDKAKEYYREANDMAWKFESETIKRLDRAIESEEQKNARILAEEKKKLDALLATQEEEGKNNEKLQSRKLRAVTEYVTGAIKANGGVLSSALELEMAQKGYYVTVDQGGKAHVTQLTKEEQATAAATLAVKKQEAAFNIAAQAGEAFGIDVRAAVGKVSAEFSKQEGQLDNFQKNLKNAGITGEQSADMVYQAWRKWLETAKSQVEIDAAKAKMVEFEKQGVFSTKQVELGVDAIKRVTQQLPAELTEVEKAFERLGIKTKEQLKLSAELALNDFETVRASGQATQEELQKAYERTIQLAHTSGDAGVIASANAKAASLGLQVQIDETGKVSVKAMGDTEESIHRVGRAARNEGANGFREMGRVAREEAKSTTEAWANAISTAAQAERDANDKKRKAVQGGSYDTFTVDEVYSRLKSLGYDEASAKKFSQSIMSEAFTKDKSIMTKNSLNPSQSATWANAEFEKLLAKGQTSSYGSQVIEERLAALARGAGSASMSSGPEKTIEYNLNFNGQTVKLNGVAGQEDMMNDFLSQLEEISKRS